ncbi:hypothetical protein M0R45_016674 [Rubus argutus]|uniref:Uncharacterized protein n=1 Tax=Rubus argutus TaxID=59490 RepID=A0AAW1XU96_RUBAR
MSLSRKRAYLDIIVPPLAMGLDGVDVGEFIPQNTSNHQADPRDITLLVVPPLAMNYAKDGQPITDETTNTAENAYVEDHCTSDYSNESFVADHTFEGYVDFDEGRRHLGRQPEVKSASDLLKFPFQSNYCILALNLADAKYPLGLKRYQTPISFLEIPIRAGKRKLTSSISPNFDFSIPKSLKDKPVLTSFFNNKPRRLNSNKLFGKEIVWSNWKPGQPFQFTALDGVMNRFTTAGGQLHWLAEIALAGYKVLRGSEVGEEYDQTKKLYIWYGEQEKHYRPLVPCMSWQDHAEDYLPSEYTNESSDKMHKSCVEGVTKKQRGERRPRKVREKAGILIDEPFTVGNNRKQDPFTVRNYIEWVYSEGRKRKKPNCETFMSRWNVFNNRRLQSFVAPEIDQIHLLLENYAKDGQPITDETTNTAENAYVEDHCTSDYSNESFVADHTFEGYVDLMRDEGTWAGTPEVKSASDLLKRPITLVSGNRLAGYKVLRGSEVGEEYDQTKKLYIWYGEQEKHYRPLVPCSEYTNERLGLSPQPSVDEPYVGRVTEGKNFGDIVAEFRRLIKSCFDKEQMEVSLNNLAEGKGRRDAAIYFSDTLALATFRYVKVQKKDEEILISKIEDFTFPENFETLNLYLESKKEKGRSG